ncbi:MAG: 2-oxo acid dehydrogenase subunit E2 [Chloroflexi bacterium]|nr:2-oxo acid dehydrogenase subunit E2 [Chloroflexota bacterium]
MATTIPMPQMGFDMKEARLLRWLKQEGDKVERGEAIAEIETDKAVLEVEAFTAGVLGRILAPQGETVPVGRAIAIIAEPGEALPPVEATEVEKKAPPVPPSEAREVAPPGLLAEVAEERVRASPAARRLAREKGVDLSQVQGTGTEGRITEKDVEAHQVSPAPSPAPSVSTMRQAIARRMAQSKREAPHFYITMDIDMGAALGMRQELNASLSEEERLTITDLAVKAVALALRQHPQFNAYFLEGRPQLQPRVNIGLAIALDEGLIAPALLDCDSKSLAQLARESKSLTERARVGRLRAEEYSQATFSLSNMGMLEVDSFQAIINPPQVAILALGAVRPQPVAREGRMVIAHIMKATLSADHRAVDGAQAARFLQAVKRALEEPSSLLG